MSCLWLVVERRAQLWEAGRAAWSRSCHCRSGWIRSWDWIRLWISHHWICKEPQPEAAAFLLRHSRICSLRSHGTVLPYDGFPPPLRILDIFSLKKSS